MSTTTIERPPVREATPLFIDGHDVVSKDRFDVLHPGSEAVFGQASAASADDIDAAIGAARRAYDSGVWSDRPREERAAMVRKLLDYFLANRETLIPIIAGETGCPTGTPVIHAQFEMPIRDLHRLIDLYLTLPDLEDGGLPVADRINMFGQVMNSARRYAPVGVVAAISAYNFPFLISVWKVVPALLTGNTVILRPSPLTPLSTLEFGKAAKAAGLPAGVLNVIAEPGAEGALTLTTDPRVDMVAFTGSSVVGEKVMAQAAPTMKRLQLELGGKSAQIYLPGSADLAIPSPRNTCLGHAGQACVAGTRVFVPQEDKARVLEGMAAALEGVIIGDPADPKTQMGPVISAAQRDRCETFVRLAVEAGAKVVSGGKRPAHLPKGFFFEPTVLDVPDNANPAAQQEIFGPVICVIGYNSVDEAVAMANDSDLGLSGYVFGKDVRQAMAVAQRIRSGTVNVNTALNSPYVSSGGWKRSGIARERGPEGLRIYQNLQVVNFSN
jgi:aldehyde dehydrogenase (NAD+)